MLYYFIVPFMLHMIIYWSTVMFFYLSDWLFLPKHDIKMIKYPKAIKTSWQNQVFVSAPVLFLLRNYIMDATISASQDSIYLTLLKAFGIINFTNMLFYSIHYLLHSKILFAHIHRIHHEFSNPIGASAYYAHPIEHLFSNVLVFAIPVITIGINYYAMLFLLVAGTFISVLAHSEYQIIPTLIDIFYLSIDKQSRPLGSNTEEYIKNIYGNNDHLAHHKYFNCNYGFGSYLDKLLGTHKSFENF